MQQNRFGYVRKLGHARKAADQAPSAYHHRRLDTLGRHLEARRLNHFGVRVARLRQRFEEKRPSCFSVAASLVVPSPNSLSVQIDEETPIQQPLRGPGDEDPPLLREWFQSRTLSCTLRTPRQSAGACDR